MVRKSFMVIAGETSGDLLAAELVQALRAKVTALEGQPTGDAQPLHASLEPDFYGAGGPHMAAAGVDVRVEMTRHAVVGLWEVLIRYRHFKRIFRQLFALAIRRQPDAIICVDFSGFNLRFAHAIRAQVWSRKATFGNWNPRIIQYVSPQVWASRPERAQRLVQDIDLVLSILPFEQQWYAAHAPTLPVEFVGHPIVERYRSNLAGQGPLPRSSTPATPALVLLPGSRAAELDRHLPVLLAALAKIRAHKPGLTARMVLPDDTLLQLARVFGLPADLQVQVGNLAEALRSADVAIASTGTVTLECAYFRVPTVALYKTSPMTYWIGKRLVRVKYLAMPNLLAGEEIFPEFIQETATPNNLAQAVLDLLDSPDRRQSIKARLEQVVGSLGSPDASQRAAEAIVALVKQPKSFKAALNVKRGVERAAGSS